jgi:dCMP deaminase
MSSHNHDHRPSWNEYFMRIAQLASTRSTCLRRQVGAVIVKKKKVLATGYNGSPSGLRHCLEVGCLREEMEIPSGQRHELCRAIHAEQNAIIQAATSGISIEGGILYSTTFPCILCAKMLINVGVKEIYVAEGYPDELSRSIMEEAGVTVSHLVVDKSPDKVEDFQP